MASLLPSLFTRSQVYSDQYSFTSIFCVSTTMEGKFLTGVDWDRRGQSEQRAETFLQAWETFWPYVPIHSVCPKLRLTPNPPRLTVYMELKQHNSRGKGGPGRATYSSLIPKKACQSC